MFSFPTSKGNDQWINHQTRRQKKKKNPHQRTHPKEQNSHITHKKQTFSTTTKNRKAFRHTNEAKHRNPAKKQRTWTGKLRELEAEHRDSKLQRNGTGWTGQESRHSADADSASSARALAQITRTQATEHGEAIEGRMHGPWNTQIKIRD